MDDEKSSMFYFKFISLEGYESKLSLRKIRNIGAFKTQKTCLNKRSLGLITEKDSNSKE